MPAFITRWPVLLTAGLAIFLVGRSATAQAPPSPEAVDIASCLCLKQEVDSLAAESAAKREEYGDTRSELARIDSRLEAERARMDVNDPEAVARFRQLLQRRDELFRHSSGNVVAGAAATTDRYNALVGEYNSRCADRPRDPRLVAQVQATLVCPRP
jgi:cysteine synthase